MKVKEREEIRCASPNKNIKSKKGTDLFFSPENRYTSRK